MVGDKEVAQGGLAPASVLLRAASMDEAMDIGSLVFHRHTITPLDRSDLPRLTMSSYASGPITIGTLQYSSGVRVATAAEVREAYQVNIPLDGTIRTGREGERIVARQQLAAVYGLHHHAFEGFETPARLLGVKFDRVALESRLEQLLGRSLGGGHIEFRLGFALDAPRARDWYVLLQMLARRLWAAGGLAQQPEILRPLQDAALTGFLLAAPHSFRDELDSPVGAATPRAVRKALAHIDGSPQAALVSVPELASIAGVSVRALQAGFRQSLDTTPLSFLHERRLTHARGELEQLDAGAVSVAEIADRWGFAHHGRFSLEYRRRFGESPSETLRR